MKKILTIDNLWRLLAAFFALNMLVVPFCVRPELVSSGPTWFGLDVSWNMMLNYANIKNMVWGKDIISTYGPLAFLATRIGWGVSRYAFLAFDLFTVLNFYFIFRDFILEATDRFIATLIVFCVTLLINAYTGSDTPWVICLFTFYWMYRAWKNPHYGNFLMINIWIVLCFFIKLNAGLVGFVFLAVLLLVFLLTRKINIKKGIVICLIPIVLVSALSIILHVSIVAYIINTFDVIRGYNDVMYLNEIHPAIENQIDILSACMAVLYVGLALWAIVKKKYEALFFIGISCVYEFLLRKQSLVRNDTQHLGEFIRYAPIILIFCNFIFAGKYAQRVYLYASLLIVLLALFYASETYPLNKEIENRYTTIVEYKNEFGDFKTQPPFLNQPDKRYIPQRVLNEIGNGAIDVFPWDCEYIFENKLNYAPRPLFQSYQAYTEKLEKANYDFYVNNSPEFILYDYDAIDNRYPFNEESLVNLFIIKNYSLADTFTSNERWRLVLRKKVEIHPISMTESHNKSILPGAEMEVDSNTFLKFDISYSFSGRIKSLLSKAPPIRVQFMLESGQWVSYKTSRELLKTGIFVGYFINNNSDFINLMGRKTMPVRIKKVKIEMAREDFSSGMVRYFKLK